MTLDTQRKESIGICIMKKTKTMKTFTSLMATNLNAE